MDFLLLLQALILGIVEGLTEFLPISSTGHLIVTADLMNFWTPDKRVVFEIAIQLGAILAVCWDYRLKLMTVTKGLLAADPGSVRFTTNVLVAFLPAAVIGFMMIGYIKTYLFNPMVVATALILGGILKYTVVATDTSWPFDNNMRRNPCPCPDRDIWTNNTIRPYLDIGGQLGTRINNRGWVDHRNNLFSFYTACSAIRMSAVAATSPSTRARQENL